VDSPPLALVILLVFCLPFSLLGYSLGLVFGAYRYVIVWTLSYWSVHGIIWTLTGPFFYLMADKANAWTGSSVGFHSVFSFVPGLILSTVPVIHRMYKNSDTATAWVKKVASFMHRVITDT
jgi:hypothetical protein